MSEQFDKEKFQQRKIRFNETGEVTGDSSGYEVDPNEEYVVCLRFDRAAGNQWVSFDKRPAMNAPNFSRNIINKEIVKGTEVPDVFRRFSQEVSEYYKKTREEK